jgi:hypothetical protein
MNIWLRRLRGGYKDCISGVWSLRKCSASYQQVGVNLVLILTEPGALEQVKGDTMDIPWIICWA